ncbi:hypothetical protein Y032_0230g2936 [Ancylostoma ceylanicum]|uniref:7TM GPCR serpentine receptor class x (Srx) domain-containing protein n=1 Tax=Ancylostoma ceylanicum TaxID=53326 RepID=A0A016SGX0_9BILA|nr:hypothetical protein Y032_0230g2936 [Ancylostoma ceylanicum]
MPISRQDALKAIQIAKTLIRLNGKHRDMSGPPDPDRTAYGVVICVSGAACILLLYMALFGRRMRRTAIRWHVMNCSWWGILHLASYGSFAEKAPWPNYIISPEWTDSSKQVENFSRSIFPCGMFFVYIEVMITTCVPRLADNWIFNLIFFILVIPVLNIIVLFCFFAQWMAVEWFYTPVDFLTLLTYVLFCIMTAVYFLFCLFGSCLCCYTVASKKPQKRTVFTFVDMWLLFPYALIPDIMYGPSFGMTSVQFVFKFLYDWIKDSGLLEGGGDTTFVLDLMTAALNALPWFVLFFPLVQAMLAVVCIKMFRQQFFFLLSCGRLYNGPALPAPKLSKDWASKSKLMTSEGF